MIIAVQHQDKPGEAGSNSVVHCVGRIDVEAAVKSENGNITITSDGQLVTELVMASVKCVLCSNSR